MGLLLAVLVASLVASLAAHAEAEGWAYDIAHELMSPFCPGRTLAECPSPQADELRLWIITQEAAGATRAEVERTLYQRFGDSVRSAPRAEGWGLTAYAIPIGGFVVGGGVAFLTLRRMVRRTPVGQSDSRASDSQASQSESTADPELERILDEKLAELG